MIPWDKTSVEVLTFWWTHGKTGTEIAKELSRTRSAVHGKIDRLGLTRETAFKKKLICREFKPIGRKKSKKPCRCVHVWLYQDEMENFEEVAEAWGTTKVNLARQAVLFALTSVANTSKNWNEEFDGSDS